MVHTRPVHSELNSQLIMNLYNLPAALGRWGGGGGGREREREREKGGGVVKRYQPVILSLILKKKNFFFLHFFHFQLGCFS